MKITVSRHKTSKDRKDRHLPPNPNGFKQTSNKVCALFESIGYRQIPSHDGIVFKSEYSDMPNLEFSNIYEAKGWLIQTQVWKED